jgi:hypothetical protein
MRTAIAALAAATGLILTARGDATGLDLGGGEERYTIRYW